MKINPSFPPIPFLRFLQKENEGEKEKERGFLHLFPLHFKNEIKQEEKENPRAVGGQLGGKTKEGERVWRTALCM